MKHPLYKWLKDSDSSKAKFVRQLTEEMGRKIQASSLDNVLRGHEPGLIIALAVQKITGEEITVRQMAEFVKKKNISGKF